MGVEWSCLGSTAQHHNSPPPRPPTTLKHIRTLPPVTAEQFALLREMADFVEQGKYGDPSVGFLCGGTLLYEVGACVAWVTWVGGWIRVGWREAAVVWSSSATAPRQNHPPNPPPKNNRSSTAWAPWPATTGASAPCRSSCIWARAPRLPAHSRPSSPPTPRYVHACVRERGCLPVVVRVGLGLWCVLCVIVVRCPLATDPTRRTLSYT